MCWPQHLAKNKKKFVILLEFLHEPHVGPNVASTAHCQTWQPSQTCARTASTAHCKNPKKVCHFIGIPAWATCGVIMVVLKESMGFLKRWQFFCCLCMHILLSFSACECACVWWLGNQAKPVPDQQPQHLAKIQKKSVILMEFQHEPEVV